MWLAATTTLVTLVLVIFGLAASLALSVAQLATLIPAYQDSFTALANDLRVWLGSLGVGPDQLQAALGKINFAGSYLLVSTASATSLWVQTATSDTGVATQPTTISTTAMTERQRRRSRGRPVSARSLAFSRRDSSSSGALVGRQVVLDAEDVEDVSLRLFAWDIWALQTVGGGSSGFRPQRPPAPPVSDEWPGCASRTSPQPGDVSHRRMSVVDDGRHQQGLLRCVPPDAQDSSMVARWMSRVRVFSSGTERSAQGPPRRAGRGRQRLCATASRIWITLDG